MNIDYLRTIHRSLGIETNKDLKISDAQQRLMHDLTTSVNYYPDAKRNGKLQPMCLVPTKVRYKATFICLPGDDIFAGDLIECKGETWLVIETNTTDPVQHLGMAWLCNHEFKWQNWTSDVIARYGVLDSGVYSTTTAGDEEVRETDKQFKIYLPFDIDTEKIFVDKRLAVDTRYNARGEQILECYKVTGSNRVARSYGNNAHLLILEIRSDNYSPSQDNFDLMICDYIAPDPSEETEIVGSRSIPIGVSRLYEIDLPEEATVSWSVTPDSLAISPDEADTRKAVLSIPNERALIGEAFSVKCESDGKEYELVGEVIA